MEKKYMYDSPHMLEQTFKWKTSCFDYIYLVLLICFFYYFQAYEKEIKELNDRLKKLEEEKELIKLDMGARYVLFCADS